MNNLYYSIIVFFLIILSVCSCKKEKKEHANSVTFDVGFEELKNYQGILQHNGAEEVYFFKSQFNPQVKFYDLDGNLKDSFSLQQVENKIGRIGRFSVISKDTMIAVSYQKKLMAGVRKDGTFIFKINLDSLSALYGENRYCFWGSFTPSPIYINKDILFVLACDGKHKNLLQTNSRSEYYKYILENRMHAPLVCKVESVYSEHPQMTYGMKDYYYNKSPEITSYGATGVNYAILNKKIFFILANDRNIYELDAKTLTVKDTILIIPQEYKIPTGIKLINKPGVSEDEMAEQELMDKCRITNMLYSDAKKQYYVFLKTAKDTSAIDELGYPFKIFVYDEHFTKKKQYAFDHDKYNPKTAMMTSKGIMIERIKKGQEYGKKTFEFMDL